ncbi:MAG: DUF1570 domain-containing protein [Thermoguttaceae bacterium]
MYRLLILTALCASWATPAFGLDHVVLRRDGREIEVNGRILLTATDGGILLQARDGVLWTVQPSEQVRETSDEADFKPMTMAELSQVLLRELPKGFDTYQTTHYLICYNTSLPYAKWCGSLFERLYMAFTNCWSRRGFDLHEPEFPLVAIVFADKRSYTAFAQAEVGEAVSSMIGYFSLQTNRMVMYDLTGVEASGQSGRSTAAQINRILAQPDAERTVATIVHEATHQIAFNCGLHTRYSDCPLWFTEGIAVFFETPDLSSPKGWRTVGALNQSRLVQFHQYLKQRPPDSLTTLISDDSRFRDVKQALDAYAEAWALTSFLINQYPRQYIAYLKRLSQKAPMVWDEPATRLTEFKQFFGDDLKKLDTEFVRFMQRAR